MQLRINEIKPKLAILWKINLNKLKNKNATNTKQFDCQTSPEGVPVVTIKNS